jgi:phosphatidylglycerol lysyltransferase
MGNHVYRHGDDFYGFEGRRAFKEKSGPEMAPPRHLTFARGISMARAVLDVAMLISRPRH